MPGLIAGFGILHWVDAESIYNCFKVLSAISKEAAHPHLYVIFVDLDDVLFHLLELRVGEEEVEFGSVDHEHVTRGLRNYTVESLRRSSMLARLAALSHLIEDILKVLQ